MREKPGRQKDKSRTSNNVEQHEFQEKSRKDIKK